MGMMSLGSYSFKWNPDRHTIPKPKKSCSSLKTYGGVEFFSWGVDLAGQEILLEWDMMEVGQFEEFSALYESDEQKPWTNDDGQMYTVEITDLQGQYFETVGSDKPYRRNVLLSLLIIAQIAGS